MIYFEKMLEILSFKTQGYSQIHEKGLSTRICAINVFIAGLIYGVSAVCLSGHILKANDAFSPFMVIAVGISAAFLIHGAAALFVWVFSRGVGGYQYFLPLYTNMGISIIAFWPAIPAIAALQAGIRGTILFLFSAVSLLYGAAVMFIGIKEASGLSAAKMAIAATITIVYIGSFLYLWI